MAGTLSAVLDMEIGAPRAASLGPVPMSVSLLADLKAMIAIDGGRIALLSDHRLLVVMVDPRSALRLARNLAGRVRSEAAAAPSWRTVLGFGHVVVDGARLHAPWMESLQSLRELLPFDSIGVQPMFGDQLMTADRRLLIPVAQSHGALLLLTSANATECVPLPSLARGPAAARLLLTAAGQSYELLGGAAPISLGRDRGSQIVLMGDAISRQHGRFESIDGEFVYIDQSRNGSWVLTASGEELRVKDERIVLSGEGAISPGLPLGQQNAAVVRFRCWLGSSSRNG